MIGHDQLFVEMKHLRRWREKDSLKNISHELRPRWQRASREYQGEDDSSIDVGEILVLEQ